MIDVHTHLGGVKARFKSLKGMIYASEKDLLEYMDEVEIEASVVLPVIKPRPEIGEDIAGADRVLSVCQGYERRLIPFCCVDPRETGASQRVRDYVGKGVKGYGEHKIELKVDNPESKEIYALCGELGLPVLLHMDRVHNPDIEAFEKVVQEYPETVFIAHGPGWWREVSAEVDKAVDYPKGKVVPGGRADVMLREYRNVYGDISAGSGLNALQRDPEFAEDFVARSWRKLLYGSDFPCLDGEGKQFGPDKLHLNLLKSLKLNDEVFQAITGNNTRRLLRLR